MNKKIIYWTPRILSLLFVAFISVFSLDVFSQFQGVQALIAFFIHLLPSFLLLAFVALAWKYGLIGAVAFIGFSAFYTFQAIEHPFWILLIAGPSFIVGLLYFWDWHLKRKVNNTNQK